MTLNRTYPIEGRMTMPPPNLTRTLRRRGAAALGGGLLAVGICTLLAVLTYHPDDPSFNTAAAAGFGNWLGAAGAGAADFLVQGFGYAGWLPPLVAIAWGVKLVRHRRLGQWGWRLAFMLLAWGWLAGGLAGVRMDGTWPYGVQPGGAFGVVMLDLMARLMPGAWGGFTPFWPAALCFAGAAAVLFPALGYSPRQWVRAGRLIARAVLIVFVMVRFAVVGLVARFSGRRLARPLLLDRTPGFTAPDAPFDEIYEEDGEDDDEPEEQAAVAIAPAAAMPRKPARKKQKKVEWRGGAFEFPPLDLLAVAALKHGPAMSESQLTDSARQLESVLADFGVEGQIVKASPGPVVTLFELEPAPGTKSARVIALSDDIARQMSALSVRVATVPGRNVLGLELPNQRRETVFLRELLDHTSYTRTQAKLALTLGKDISGEPMVADLARMPHLLVAGTTGSGKSVAINTMILSLLYRLSPEQLRFILIDPKMLELSVYEGIPHLLSPVVTEPKKAVVALKWTVREMEDRYRAMSKLGVRNIDNFNERIKEARAKNEVLTRRIQTGFDADTGKPVFEEQPIELIELPSIVVVVDEMADLMLVAGKEVEASIQRLAQMARAAGIHIIMATQRPSVDVITGTIKANFPSRISFQVTSKIDSRTILSEQGAEQLLGQGDMLYMAGGGRITRVHGPFVSDTEVEQVVRHLKQQGEPAYVEAVTFDEAETGGEFGEGEASGSGDELYDKAVSLVLREKKASTSFVQRYLQIGYNRAARIVDRMEAEGVISAPNHVGKREVLAGEGVR